jgi:hypothetical protein
VCQACTSTFQHTYVFRLSIQKTQEIRDPQGTLDLLGKALFFSPALLQG